MFNISTTYTEAEEVVQDDLQSRFHISREWYKYNPQLWKINEAYLHPSSPVVYEIQGQNELSTNYPDGYPSEVSFPSSSTRNASLNRRVVQGPNAEQNQLLSPTYQHLLTPDADQSKNDSILNVAKVWSDKLKDLEPRQRLFAEKAINDVLYHAQLGYLDINSVQINENRTSPRPN